MNKLLVVGAIIAAPALTHAEPVTFAIDPMHTFVTFEAKHMGTSTLRGRFDKKDGSVTLDRSTGTGSTEITIDTASISTGVAPLDSNLKSKNFFNVAEFPTAKFTAGSFGFSGDKVTAVSGALTLLGKTLPVSLAATNFNCYINPLIKRETCGGDFETTITRSQFGMNFGLNFGVPDSIRLVVQVEAIKQ